MSYTIGEIIRLKLLLNHNGEPYKHKASLVKLFASMKTAKVKTPWGMGYAITKEQIDKLNARWD